VDAGAGEPDQSLTRRREVTPRLSQIGLRLGRPGQWRGHDLDLRGRHLELEAPVAAAPLDQLRRDRGQVERLGVEQHQLLLDPYGQRRLRVEQLPQLGSGRVCRLLGAGRRQDREP
jgi:hypothetical protein